MFCTSFVDDGLEEKPTKKKAAPKRKLTKRKAAGEGTKAAKAKAGAAAAASKKRKAIEIGTRRAAGGGRGLLATAGARCFVRGN